MPTGQHNKKWTIPEGAVIVCGNTMLSHTNTHTPGLPSRTSSAVPTPRQATPWWGKSSPTTQPYFSKGFWESTFTCSSPVSLPEMFFSCPQTRVNVNMLPSKRKSPVPPLYHRFTSYIFYTCFLSEVTLGVKAFAQEPDGEITLPTLRSRLVAYQSQP